MSYFYYKLNYYLEVGTIADVLTSLVMLISCLLMLRPKCKKKKKRKKIEIRYSKKKKGIHGGNEKKNHLLFEPNCHIKLNIVDLFLIVNEKMTQIKHKLRLKLMLHALTLCGSYATLLTPSHQTIL